jgi:hypothetical protein
MSETCTVLFPPPKIEKLVYLLGFIISISQPYILRSLHILFCITDFHSYVAVTILVIAGIFYGVQVL